MRIGRRTDSPHHLRQLKPDLETAIAGRGPDGRICGAACSVTCHRCGSTACQCMCTPDCREAPRALSADPEKFPIEPAITPLVFALKRTGLFEPCWSCEGHLDADGRFWKAPQVWFYCASQTHVRLLSQGIATLVIRRRLTMAWQVTVTFSDPDNPHTTFALQPTADAAATPDLAALQADAVAIARALPALLREEAEIVRRGVAAAPVHRT